MTTGYWLLPEDSPCEFHNNQWNHSSFLHFIIKPKSSILKPWAFIGVTPRHRASHPYDTSRATPVLQNQKRKWVSSDYGAFGLGCGVRNVGATPPPKQRFFAQPMPSTHETQLQAKRDLRWQREHIILTSKHLPSRAPLPDKGKLVVRRGRKATDQISDLRAGLPEEE